MNRTDIFASGYRYVDVAVNGPEYRNMKGKYVPFISLFDMFNERIYVISFPSSIFVVVFDNTASGSG
jgi:hypothetical protein